MTTAGAPAFESALPSTVRIVSEGFVSSDEDHIELTAAGEDIAGLMERNSVGDILRGAVLSPSLAVDTYYTAAASNLSPFFQLPVDAVQRGRDHGLPTYNAAREVNTLGAKDQRGYAIVPSPQPIISDKLRIEMQRTRGFLIR